MNINNLWKSGFVRRWHSNPDLAHTVDRIDGHQWRVAILVDYMIVDCPRDVIMFAMVHDVAELITGDVSYTAKRRYPEINKLLTEISADHTPEYQVTDWQERVVKLCDLIDARKWMLQHNISLAKNADWILMESNMSSMAYELGLSDKFDEVMNG